LLAEIRAAGGGKPDPLLDYQACMFDAEAHDALAAERSCRLVMDAPKASQAQRQLAQLYLAQAAYWAGDRTRASQLARPAAFASENVGAADRFLARLIVAAADGKSREGPAARREVEKFIAELEKQNGAADAETFLRRRPLQEFLKELGYAKEN
jgi:hypothetical protein